MLGRLGEAENLSGWRTELEEQHAKEREPHQRRAWWIFLHVGLYRRQEGRRTLQHFIELAHALSRPEAWVSQYLLAVIAVRTYALGQRLRAAMAVTAGTRSRERETECLLYSRTPQTVRDFVPHQTVRGFAGN